MGDRSFYLYPRNGVYYAELLSYEGSRALYRSTGSRNRDEAAAIVGRWLEKGIPTKDRAKPLKVITDFKNVMAYLKTGDIDETAALEIASALRSRGLLDFPTVKAGPGNVDFIIFLQNFWDYDNSPYIREKRAHGKNITKRACHEANLVIARDWKPFFKDKTLSEITRNNLRDFGLLLRERLASKTTNNYIAIGATAIRWAFNEGMIPKDITKNLNGFVGGERKRDILTYEEIEKLKDFQYWENKKTYTAFRLASSSALRSGECCALQREDIGEAVLYVRHGYNRIDKLKSTKTEQERKVYLLREVRALLLDLLKENPCTDDPPKQYIFYSDTDPEKPCNGEIFRRGLMKAIKSARIDLAGRRIDFHSLRHYVATKWANGTKGDLRQVQKVTGHKSLTQAARYADHIEEQEIAAMGETAANILSFPVVKKGA